MAFARPLALALIAGTALTVAADDVDDKLSRARALYEKKLADSRKDAHGAFARSLDTLRATSPNLLPASERDRLAAELAPQIEAFGKTGRVGAGLATHEAGPKYLGLVRLATGEYASKLRDLGGGRKPGHPVQVKLTAASDAAYESVNGFDLFQPGTVWDGVRYDKAPPPQVQKFNNPFRPGHSRYHIRRPGGGQVDWDLKVVSRTRDQVELQVSQGGGRAKWKMVGTFDGLTLRASNKDLPNFGMLEGAAWRVFDYSGVVVGDAGDLAFTGYKADGKPTVGRVWIGLRK